MAELLIGAPVAAALIDDLSKRITKLEKHGTVPCLAILRVGEDESAKAYEHAIIKRCEEIGIRNVCVVLDEKCLQEELVAAIEEINADCDIHGCLMFRPLPKHLDEFAVCETLAPEKDVDCITSASLNTLLTGHGVVFLPCTAQACLELLAYYGIDTAGKNVAVIGRSLVIGKPVSLLLQARDATVTMCHTKTRNMAEICKKADILVVSAGKAGIVDANFTNPNQIVVDLGINPMPTGGICGDVDFLSVEKCVRAISPVPGGVGSITTAVLAKHVVEAAERVIK